MQRSPGLEETPSLPVKCTQTGNKHSEHLMTEKQEGQSTAAATGTVKSIPRSGFLILFVTEYPIALSVIQSQ